MNTDSRLFAVEIAEAFHGTEDRAWTCYHAGQLTISDYRRLEGRTGRDHRDRPRQDPNRCQR